MRARLSVLSLTAFVLLASAVPAFARDNGEGLLGETNDKTVTFFSLGVLLFFVIFTSIGSFVQFRGEKKKDAKKAAKKLQRTGW